MLVDGGVAVDAPVPADAAAQDAGPEPGMDAGPDEQPLALCQPGPHWLTEGETLEIALMCADGDDQAGAGGTPGLAIDIEPLPEGAVYDPATGRLTWTPALDQAAVYELQVSLPGRDESATLTIGVADRWDHPDNVPIVDPEAYPLEYGVPVFFLSPAPEDDDDYEFTTIVYGGRTYYAKAKMRGSASLHYPKNSYTLKFPKHELFSDPERAGGFLNKRKVVLTTTFDDNSYIRQRLAFELWNRLDPAHIQVQSYMAMVYLEDEFWGLYAVTDHIDDDLMEQNGLWRDGNLYKAKSSSADFRLVDDDDGDPKEDILYGFEKKEGEPEDGPDAFADLEELIYFVATADEETIERELGMRIDLRDYQNWMLMVSFMAGGDSGANNVYHYHDPGSPWRMVMWDFNATFGQNYVTERKRSGRMGAHEDDNRIFEHFLEIPTFAEQVEARYRAALDGVFSVPYVHALIEEIRAGLGDVISRDQARWREEYEDFERWDDRDDFTTPEEEIEYIRTWIAERWGHLDEIY